MAITFAQSCKEVTQGFFENEKVFFICNQQKLTVAPCFLQVVHVFALEKENSPPGQRIYLVTSYSELWHYYGYVSDLHGKNNVDQCDCVP